MSISKVFEPILGSLLLLFSQVNTKNLGGAK